jgi:hypothetical protein
MGCNVRHHNHPDFAGREAINSIHFMGKGEELGGMSMPNVFAVLTLTNRNLVASPEEQRASHL